MGAKQALDTVLEQVQPGALALRQITQEGLSPPSFVVADTALLTLPPPRACQWTIRCRTPQPCEERARGCQPWGRWSAAMRCHRAAAPAYRSRSARALPRAHGIPHPLSGAARWPVWGGGEPAFPSAWRRADACDVSEMVQ